MADKKISELTGAGTLTGTEEVPIVQSGVTVKTTTQDIADLGGGGGGTWGSITGTLSSQTDLQNALDAKLTKFEKLGEIYNKDSWVDLSDFTSNSATVSVVSNKLSFSGAGNNFLAGVNVQLTRFLRINGHTGLSRWVMTAKVKVNQVPDATSHGFSMGVIGDNASNSTESSALGTFNMSTVGLTGRASLVVGTGNNLVVSSVPTITFAQNDVIEMRVERILQMITVSCRNITTGGATTTATYNYNTNFADGTTNPFIQNSGTFVIGQNGGSFVVNEIVVESSEIVGANVMLIGDSKMNYSSPYDLQPAFLLNKYYNGVIVNAGPIDTTQGVINKLPEIIALAPKQVVINIGRNDVALAVPTLTWQANLVTIDTDLVAAGIDVYWCDSTWETTTANVTPVRDYVRTQFAGRVINSYDSTNFAAALSSDNVHPSIAGHQALVDAIIFSNLLIDYSEENSNEQNSQSFEDIRFNGYILGGNGTIARPSLATINDILLLQGKGIRSCFAANNTWQAGYIPFSGSTASQYINTFSASNLYSHQFIGNGGTNGNQVTTFVITDRGNVLVTPLGTGIPANFEASNTGMYLCQVAKGLEGQFLPVLISSTGNRGSFLPINTNYTTQIRNYSRNGGLETYVSNGVDNTQVLAQKTDALGSTSFFGDGVQFPNMTTAQRDALGKVISAFITTTGSGYTSDPTVSITGGGGTGATATAQRTTTTVTGVTITAQGSGFTSIPTISFSGGGGTGAVATVVCSLLRAGLVIYNTTTNKLQCYDGTIWNDLF